MFIKCILIKSRENLIESLFGASSQCEIDIFQFQWTEDVACRCVWVVGSKEFDHQFLVAIKRNGSVDILRLI